jgi:hypothetical protein
VPSFVSFLSGLNFRPAALEPRTGMTGGHPPAPHYLQFMDQIWMYFDAGTPQIGQFSGGVPISTWPQTGQR